MILMEGVGSFEGYFWLSFFRLLGGDYKQNAFVFAVEGHEILDAFHDFHWICNGIGFKKK